MNLSISKERAKSLFGGDFVVKARLNASEAELQNLLKDSLGGGYEMTKLPNGISPKLPHEPLFLGEILNRDWEYKCKTMPQAEIIESLVIQACQQLKVKMEQAAGSGPKTIEL